MQRRDLFSGWEEAVLSAKDDCLAKSGGGFGAVILWFCCILDSRPWSPYHDFIRQQATMVVTYWLKEWVWPLRSGSSGSAPEDLTDSGGLEVSLLGNWQPGTLTSSAGLTTYSHRWHTPSPLHQKQGSLIVKTELIRHELTFIQQNNYNLGMLVNV